MQSLSFFLPALRRYHLGGLVLPRIGDVTQPFKDFEISRLDIQGQARLLELRDQGHIEAVAQITDEALDLALGLVVLAR